MCGGWGLQEEGKQDQTKYEKSLDSIQKSFEKWKHLHKITGLGLGWDSGHMMMGICACLCHPHSVSPFCHD